MDRCGLSAVVLLIGAVAGVGYGLVYPLLNGLAYERLESYERGRGVSLVAACIDAPLASASMPWVSARLYA